mmetsp:Transcript_51152/g.135483  ORF Transcript_51152/g.135483 Transcript_51152/m.135483 type:complete len:232 (+) Transcript_51152:451-1146(+)
MIATRPCHGYGSRLPVSLLRLLNEKGDSAERTAPHRCCSVSSCSLVSSCAATSRASVSFNVFSFFSRDSLVTSTVREWSTAFRLTRAIAALSSRERFDFACASARLLWRFSSLRLRAPSTRSRSVCCRLAVDCAASTARVRSCTVEVCSSLSRESASARSRAVSLASAAAHDVCSNLGCAMFCGVPPYGQTYSCSAAAFTASSQPSVGFPFARNRWSARFAVFLSCESFGA